MADLCMWLGIVSLAGSIIFEAPLRQLISQPNEYSLISVQLLEGEKNIEPDSSDSSSEQEEES